MKKIFLFALIACLCSSAQAQFVAKMEVKEHIEGVCDEKEVYALLPLDGQQEAKWPISENEMVKRLNNEVEFLKLNPKHDDKGMINIIINCKGELVRCEMDTDTKSKELDDQIVAVFKTLVEWKPGKLYGKPVDSVVLWSFTIKNGKLIKD